MVIVWSLALVAAVLWPAHLIGPLDGAPLEKPFEAVLLAVVLPTLWSLHPAFLRSWFARLMILGLLAWKIGGALVLAQGGWCGEFLTPYPDPGPGPGPGTGSYRLERSWDLRTYLEPSPAGCSAIVSRGYRALEDFPAWSINVPFDWDWIFNEGPTAVTPAPPRPPAGAYRMVVSGWMRPSAPGILAFDIGNPGDPGNTAQIDGAVDGTPLPAARDTARGNQVEVELPAGSHEVTVSLALTGEQWRFVPTWNGRDLFATVPTSLSRATLADRLAGRWAARITPILILTLCAVWFAAALSTLRPGWPLVAWIAASLAFAVAAGWLHRDPLIRWGMLGLVAAAAVPVSPRVRNWRGALLLVGVPWLCVLTVRSIPHVGQFTIFTQGDDWLTFQRFAYRIFMRGYWLQGGEPTFWYQPLYRWTTGLLHLIFGDSSVGDLYWDMFGLLIGALFVFQVVSRSVGFRSGVIGAALMLATVALGPNWYIIGRGLSEISSSAWLLLAAMNLTKARTGELRYAVVAAMFAVLAFYTRLNHLPLAIVLVVFTLPDELPARSWFHLRTVWARLPKRVAATYLGCFGLGLCAFASRTWYYTGHFSIFAGTTRRFNGTGLDFTADSMSSFAVWRRAVESVMMIATVQDPPRFDPRSIVVVAGVCACVLALLRTPIARRLPLHVTVACVGAIAGGLVARGIAYPGRFSIHLIPFAVAAAVIVAALAFGGRVRNEQAPSPQ